jgi:hypothetical protein
MPPPKTIKTDCGIDKYRELQNDKSWYGKLRITWFVAIATLKDFKKQ